MSEERSPYAATGAIQRMRERLAADTPGRRLHAALLAHGIESDNWDDYHPTYQAAYEAAAREVGGSGVKPDHLWSAEAIDILATVGQLANEVAALRRDRDADDAAFAEIGDRLAILESSKESVGSWLLSLNGWRRTQEALGPFASQSEIDDCETRLARCEGRDGEIIERLTQLERAEQAHGRAIEHRTAIGMRRVNDHESRLAALEAWRGEIGRKHDGLVSDTMAIGHDVESRLAALEARALDGGDPLRRTG